MKRYRNINFAIEKLLYIYKERYINKPIRAPLFNTQPHYKSQPVH